MRAVVWKAPYEVAVEQVDDPRIQEPTDAVMRLTTAAICGSDLHMYEGRAPIEPGQVFGHENLGVIEQVGPARAQRQGRATASCCRSTSAAGSVSTARAATATRASRRTRRATPAATATPGMGPHRGGQAELVRVPYADYNCLKLPGTPGDQFEDDFVLLADVFPTGYHATEQAHVQPGDTVAIFGAGPVGTMAALSAKIRGASEIYVVDAVRERLDSRSRSAPRRSTSRKATPWSRSSSCASRTARACRTSAPAPATRCPA